MNNPLIILSPEGNELYQTPINSGCKRKVTLMNEDCITVKFSDKNKIDFPIGSHIEDFYITKTQDCKLNTTTGAYDYELTFDAYYYLWANKLLRYIVPGVVGDAYETSFKLTATIDIHAGVILRALNALGYTYAGSPFRIDTTDTSLLQEAKYINYNNLSILDGIAAIADAWECEWWVKENAIYFGKCSFNKDYVFEVGDNVESVSSSTKDTNANRIIVFGSERNLPSNYRVTTGVDTIGGIVNKRLLLPEGYPYLQIKDNIPPNEVVEEVVVFDDIYPKTSLTVTDVSSYIDTDTGDDGEEYSQTFFRIKYGNGFPFLEEYILPETELHIVFESGMLSGMDFAVNFNPTKEVETVGGVINPESQVFEIIANEDYGRALPDEVLHPQVGDKFIVYGWDATKMENLGLIAEAEQKLLEEGLKLLDEYRKDISTYTCVMMWDWCKEYAQHSNLPQLGSTVQLHFDKGDEGRTSRIIGFEYDLDTGYSGVIFTCGEKVSVSRLKNLENKVEGLVQDGTKMVAQNGLDYLSKRYSDATPFSLSIGGALKSYDFIRGVLTGLGWGLYRDEDSNATVEADNLVIRNQSVFQDNLSSPDFISGFLSGKGWAIIKEQVINSAGVEEPKYRLEIDKLDVRGSLRVFEMIASQFLGENDNRVFTGMMEVDHYDPETGRIWLNTQGGKLYNPFHKGDYILVQRYNGFPSSSNDYYVTKAYEFIIAETGIGNTADGEDRLDWVKFENFIPGSESGTPESLITEKDTLTRVDNETDPDRKGIMQIISVGNKTPYMDVIYGLKTDPDDYLKARLGNLEGIRHHLFGWLQGFGLFSQNAYLVGDFRLRRTGDSIDAQIEMLKSMFASQYSEITYAVTEEANYLTNATFTENMEYWEVIADDSSIAMLPDGDSMLINGNLLLVDSYKAQLTEYEGRQMLLIVNSGVRQLNQYIRKPETHNVYDSSKGITTQWDSNVEGSIDNTYEVKKDTLYLTIKFLASTSGNLTIGFRGATTDLDSLPNPTTVYVNASSEWQLMDWIGTWDGKGDFVLEYTGTMYVQLLSLTSDPLADYKQEMGTRIEQTSRNIRLLGYNIDQKTGQINRQGIEISNLDNSVKIFAEETRQNFAGVDQKIAEIIVTANSIQSRVETVENGVRTNASLIEQKANEITSTVSDFKNNVVSYINQSAESVTIDANKINLRGFTSINNFLIDEYGNVTINGKLLGLIRFYTGYSSTEHIDTPDNFQIFAIMGKNGQSYYDLGWQKEDVGKVVWIRNFGDDPDDKRIRCYRFYIDGNGLYSTMTDQYLLGPGEAAQFTCFQIGENLAEWVMTARFGKQQFRNGPVEGRYPLLWAAGSYNPYGSGTGLKGTFYDGRDFGSAAVSRSGTGKVTLQFMNNAFPSNYAVFCQSTMGYTQNGGIMDDHATNVMVAAKTTNSITFVSSDDDSANDCAFEFFIYALDNWEYSN